MSIIGGVYLSPYLPLDSYATDLLTTYGQQYT